MFDLDSLVAPFSTLVELLDITIKVSILVLLASLVVRIFCIKNAIWLNRVWSLVLIGMVLMPVLVQVVPAVEINCWIGLNSKPQMHAANDDSSPKSPGALLRFAGTQPVRVSSEPSLPPARTIFQSNDSSSAAVATATATAPSDSSRSASARVVAFMSRYWMTMLVTIYLAGFLTLLARLVLGMVQCARISRRARRIELPDSMSWTTPLIVKETGELAVPATVGLFQPTVLLPNDWRSWDNSLVEMALIHEAEHVRRADTWGALLCSFNCALYWFNPLAWRLRIRISEVAEQVCDDLVVQKTEQPLLYAERLVEMASRLNSGSFGYHAVGVGMARACLVEKRVLRIIDATGTASRRPSLFANSAVLCFVGVAALLTAGLHRPTSSVAAEPQAANGAEKGLEGKEGEQQEKSPDGVVQGRVVMPDGAPVADAEVRLLTWSANATRYETKKARTNERGEFVFKELSEGKHRMAAYFEDYASRTKRNSGGADVVPGAVDVELRLHKAPSLKVTVLNRKENKPIPNARVRITWTDTERDHFTDDTGVLTLRGLTPEVWTIEVQAKGYAEQVHAMNLTGSATSEVTAHLDPGLELFGTIRDEQGLPLEDVGIMVFPGDMRGEQIEYMTTDKEGRYRFEYLPRSALTLFLQKDDYQWQQWPVEIGPSEGAKALDLAPSVRPFGGSVAGFVLDSSGVPIVGAKVSNHGRFSRDVRSTETDARGAYRLDNVFEGIRGYAVIVEAKGFAPRVASFVPGSNDSPAQVSVSLQPGHRVSGTIVDDQGRKLGGVTVTANGVAGSAVRSRQTTQSDASGRFEIDSLPADSPLDFRKSGYSTIEDKVLPRGGTEAVIVKMLAEGVIRGIAIDDSTGKPLTQFVVAIIYSPDRKPDDPSGSLSGPRAFDGERFSNESGVFELRDLIQGMPLQVTVESVGYNPKLERRVLALADAKSAPIEFRLKKVD